MRDEHNHPTYIDGVLEDVTTARKQEAGREALIEKLQSSLLFLHEPVANLGRDVVVCRDGYEHRTAGSNNDRPKGHGSLGCQ